MRPHNLSVNTMFNFTSAVDHTGTVTDLHHITIVTIMRFEHRQ